MKTDIEFSFDTLMHSTGHHIARLATLWPLVNKVPAVEAGQLNALNNLLRLWRARAYTLFDNGWLDGDRRKLWYIRNCLPSMALTAPTPKTMLKPCLQSHVCPWCYARHVGKTCNRIIKLLPESKTLVLARVMLHCDLLGSNTYDIKPDKQHFSNVIAEEIGWGVTSAIHTTLEPIPKVTDPDSVEGAEITSWLMTYTRVMLLPFKPSGITFSGELSKWDITCCSPDNKNDVRTLLRKAFKYPRELFFGDGKLVSELLAGTYRQRLRENTGMLHNKAYDKFEAERKLKESKTLSPVVPTEADLELVDSTCSSLL